MNERAQKICDRWVSVGCEKCPLRKPCTALPDDTREIFNDRMNAAAADMAERL